MFATFLQLRWPAAHGGDVHLSCETSPTHHASATLLLDEYSPLVQEMADHAIAGASPEDVLQLGVAQRTGTERQVLVYVDHQRP
jgi:hypothetical protein